MRWLRGSSSLAWLDQRVKEGELDIVFDDATHSFGCVQPGATTSRSSSRPTVLAPHRVHAIAVTLQSRSWLSGSSHRT